MKKNWKILPQHHIEIIDQLLFNRGWDISQKDAFLSPDFEVGLCSSADLPCFDIFLSRIKRAVSNSERVAIYADYDADGIPGAAFLYKALRILGLDVETYIPSREEGYGISLKGLDYLIEKKCTLIITVDLGIRNIEESEYASKHNIDLIITDHHLPGDKLPQALAVINPKIPGSKYAFKELSGAGVIYKLIYGLKEHFPEITNSFLKWNLDLLAISTISDVVPLTGENRIIANFGLKVINKSKNIGIKKIVEKSNLKFGKIGSYEVGFVIAPRINAPGRLSTPIDSFRLLTTQNSTEADALANTIENENSERQKIMADLILEAEKMIKRDNLTENKMIILSGEWHKGVLGPCASKIAEKYSRPTILFSSNSSDEIIIGSARSVNSINIMEIITKASKWLEKFGGHSGAAGISVRRERYMEFRRSILEVASKNISESDLERVYQIDKEIDFNEISISLINKIDMLEPFGQGNEKPLFLTRLSKMHYPKFVGKESNHLSSILAKNNKKIKSIYFNCPINSKEVNHLSDIDLIYHIDQQEWNGDKYIQIKVVDMELL